MFFITCLILSLISLVTIVTQEFGKCLVVREQLRIRARLGDLPINYDDDVIHLGEEADAVGDQDPCLLRQETPGPDDVVKDVLADVGIHGAERVVKEIDVRIVVDGSSQANSLLLSTTKIDTLTTPHK